MAECPGVRGLLGPTHSMGPEPPSMAYAHSNKPDVFCLGSQGQSLPLPSLRSSMSALTQSLAS